MGGGKQIEVECGENTDVALQQKVESTRVRECGDKNGQPENSEEQDCSLAACSLLNNGYDPRQDEEALSQ